jgi:hypothetical protein
LLYTFDLPWALGSLETSAHYLDTQRLRSQVATASPNELAGSLGGPDPGPAKSKGTLDILYTNQGFSWDWQGIFVGPMNLNNQLVTGDQNYMTVGHWWLINSTLGMKFIGGLQVLLEAKERVRALLLGSWEGAARRLSFVGRVNLLDSCKRD